MSLAESPNSLPGRILARTPILGGLSRAIGRDINLVFYILTILVTLMVLAIQVWGIAALVVTYVALVPVIFALLIRISWP